jgi:hypothetical protein
VTLREAKESLKALLQDNPRFAGIGLGRDCLSVLWIDEDDHPEAVHEGWPVQVTIVDIPEAFGDEE